MPICPDCKSSELVQSVDPEYMACTVCKAKFKLGNVQKFQDEIQLWKDRFGTCVKKGAVLEGRLDGIHKKLIEILTHAKIVAKSQVSETSRSWARGRIQLIEEVLGVLLSEAKNK